VRKHYTNNNCHGSSAYQKHVSVLELFSRREFKYECVVYACLSPHENVTSIEEEMQKEEAEHAAVWDQILSAMACLNCSSFSFSGTAQWQLNWRFECSPKNRIRC